MNGKALRAMARQRAFSVACGFRGDDAGSGGDVGHGAKDRSIRRRPTRRVADAGHALSRARVPDAVQHASACTADPGPACRYVIEAGSRVYARHFAIARQDARNALWPCCTAPGTRERWLGQQPIRDIALHRRSSFHRAARLSSPHKNQIRREELPMYRATKDIILPTTITGSLPRPSWYTENLGTRHFLEAMVTRRFREQYEDALTCYLRDQETRRPRHPHRRRLPLRRRRRRPELDRLSAECTWRASSIDNPRADAGRPRRRLVSARPHPARLSGVAGDAGR